MKKIVISILFLLGAIQANSSDWISFGQGEERKYRGNLFIIEYPSDFTFSPESQIFPIDYHGERKKTEDNGIDFLMLESQQREFRITAVPFVPHYTNKDGLPMNVKDTLAFLESRLCLPKVEYRKDCTVVHGFSRNRLEYIAYFIPNDVPSEFGVNLQLLYFTYPNPIIRIDPVIMEIISRFKSSYEI